MHITLLVLNKLGILMRVFYLNHNVTSYIQDAFA